MNTMLDFSASGENRAKNDVFVKKRRREGVG
jgi:hypothetical protein